MMSRVKKVLRKRLVDMTSCIFLDPLEETHGSCRILIKLYYEYSINRVKV